MGIAISRAKRRPFDPLAEERRKQKGRASRRRSLYKLSDANYAKMVLAQGNRCAICDSDAKPLHVDHDHKTGEVRGLLCFRCNSGLGNFSDEIGRLATAIAYLARPMRSQAITIHMMAEVESDEKEAG